MSRTSDDVLRAEMSKPSRNAKPARNATTASATKATKTDGADAPTTRTPRVKIDPGATPSQVLAAHITDKESLYAAAVLHKGENADHHAVNRLAKILDATGAEKLAKKVGEKAINLLRFRSQPDQVQVYTRIGLDALIAQGSVTSKSLVQGFQGRYKDGTARAQSNQLMQLFPALGIATREGDRGSTLRLNKDSAIVADYKKASK